MAKVVYWSNELVRTYIIYVLFLLMNPRWLKINHKKKEAQPHISEDGSSEWLEFLLNK